MRFLMLGGSKDPKDREDRDEDRPRYGRAQGEEAGDRDPAKRLRTRASEDILQAIADEDPQALDKALAAHYEACS